METAWSVFYGAVGTLGVLHGIADAFQIPYDQKNDFHLDCTLLCDLGHCVWLETAQKISVSNGSGTVCMDRTVEMEGNL